MASGDPSDAAAAAAAADSSSGDHTPARLREELAALSQAFESSDTTSSDAAVSSVSDILAEADADPAAVVSAQLLREVHSFLTCPSSNQMAIDALSLELPTHVAKLGAQKGNNWDIANTIIEFFVSNCNPRDMLSILCEALDTPVELNRSAYFVLLLDGLARDKKYSRHEVKDTQASIVRRHIEQVKVVLPAVLRVMHATVSECDEEHGQTAVDLFDAALRIGNAIQEMCKIMVNHKKEELCSILGLYALQCIALVSRSKNQHILLTRGSIVLQHSKFLMLCGFTYLGLLTGNDVTSATNKLSKGICSQSDIDEDADFRDSFSFAMDGASLVAVWTYMHDEMSKYAGAELETTLKEVQDNCTRKWEAINMFRYVLSSFSYPWAIKSHSIDLLLTLVDENHIEETNNHVDFLYTQFFATFKAIESVMIAAPDALMRKKAFAALKKVISVVPSSQRFDILQALIKNSMFPSLTAILLDLVKNEVLRENRRAGQDCIESNRSQEGGELPPWASHALEFVELILRPPEGGPPCLPDHNEQVLSALNLLRLILLIDSGGSSSAKLFRKETIRKVYSEWLIPLRPIVAGIQSEIGKDDGEDANQMMCLLNPVQLVLHRCIELTEEKIKGS